MFIFSNEQWINIVQGVSTLRDLKETNITQRILIEEKKYTIAKIRKPDLTF